MKSRDWKKSEAGLVPTRTPDRLNDAILFLDDDSRNFELEAAYQWLQTHFPAARRISPREIPANGKNHVIWWHGTDKTQNVNRKSSVIKSLRNFLQRDGRLLLSLSAVQAVAPLGLEKKPPDVFDAGNYDPQTRPPHEWIAPQGYEIRGLMGFLGHLQHRPAWRDEEDAPHALLAPFGGGIYLWNAKAGAPYWRCGYGPRRWPKGKVWGVHRYYIGFDPDQKLAWEYDEPRVLCVGAYLYFADAENLFRQSLEAFAETCLRYLLDKQTGAARYWEPAGAGIKEKKRLVEFPQWEELLPIRWNEVSPFLIAGPASNNFFDLAGERILLMGNERGPITEIWSPPLRLCRNLSLSIKTAAGEKLWEHGDDTEVTIRPHQIERRRQTGNFTITERIWVSAEAPLACLNWEIEGSGLLYFELSFEVDFRVMWPYPAGVLSKLAYQISDRRGRSSKQVHVSDYRHLFLTHFAIHLPGASVKVEDISVNDESRARVTFRCRIDLRGKRAVRFVVLGGETQDRQLQAVLTAFPEQLSKLYSQQVARQNRLLEKFAELDTPDPRFNAAARWAKIKTEAFVCRVPSLGRSLLAGFANTRDGWNSGRPGYAWFFGRDAGWTAFAMLHYGDFANVKEVLRFLGRHQDLSGKIFHELTTSGATHYDAADSTPLYLVLMGRYLAHSGDLAFIKKEWPRIEKAMTFLFSTDRDGDGLIENTGVGHGWIEGGKLFGAHTEHYLAGCWAEALAAASRLATALGKTELAEKWTAQHQQVRAMLEHDFWNEEVGYFYHGKNIDGSFDSNVTALAAVPLLFGYGKPEDGMQALRRLAGKSFNADWGVRLVSDDHPFYDPQGYHYGSVWPLLTGWTALAEFRYGRWLQGLMHIQNSMRNFQHGALGCTEEVLHGEFYQPAGVCPQQAWSASMILQSIYEGLLGIKPYALENRLELAPYIPLHWPFFSAGPIRVGNQQLLFSMRRNENVLTFQFSLRPAIGKKHSPPLRVDFKPIFPASAPIEELRQNDELLDITPEKRTNFMHWPISFELSENVVSMTLRLAKFFTVVPPFAEVNPGERSHGWVIIDQKFDEKNVILEAEGEPGSEATLEFVIRGYALKEIKGGKLIEWDGEQGRIIFQFPTLIKIDKKNATSSLRYTRQMIQITLS
jgi:glycogen debranching enzyme